MKSNRYSLKPLITSLFLALGLTPFGGEVFADPATDPKSTTTSVFTGTLVQNTHYAPQLNLGGFYGTNGNSYGEADVWTPVWQSWDRVAYVDVRYQKNENTQWDFAAGAGYRWLSDDMERLYDVYGFYNTYNSSYNNQFQQVMGGGTVRTDNWTVRGNYYYSIGPTQYGVSSLDKLALIPAVNPQNALQNYGLISYGFENNYINGGVIEIGRTIPYSAGLSLFGGYYGFASSEARPFVNGFRARAEYKLDEAFNFKTPFVRHITLESMYQYDNVYQGAFTVGARLDIPLGKSYTNSKLQDAMMDYVRFYPHAIQENVTGTTPVIYAVNGTPWIFDRVSNVNDFTQAMEDNSNVVIIENNLQFTQTETVTDNKYITGQNYEYAPGKLINVTGKSTLPTMTGANGRNIFVVGSGDTIRDVILTTTGSPTIADPVNPTLYQNALLSAITNEGTSSVGNLTIDNISTNGAISIVVSDGSSDSVINITNSHFNPLYVPFTSNTLAVNAIDIRSGATTGGAVSLVTVNSIDNNEFNFTSNTGGVANYHNAIVLFGNTAFSLTPLGVFKPVGTAGDLNVVSISGNHINFGENAFGSGIRINYSVHNQTVGNIDNNVISFGDFTPSLFDPSDVPVGGILITNPTTTGQTINSVSGNIINFGSGLSVAEGYGGNSQRVVGIYLNNQFDGATQTVNNVDNNQITFGAGANVVGSGAISGIWLGTNGYQTVTSVTGNEITFGDNASVASDITQSGPASLSGIYIFNYIGDTQTISALNNNTVTFGAGAISEAGASAQASVTMAGIYVNNYGFNLTPPQNQVQTIAMEGNKVVFSGATSASGDDSTIGLLGGFIFTNGIDIPATATSAQQISFINNSVAFEGVQSGSDTQVNTYGINVITNSSTATTVFSDFYGNNITGSNGAFAIQNAQLMNTVAGGTITININDPAQPDNPGGINGLIAANNDIQFPSGQGTGTTINGKTPA